MKNKKGFTLVELLAVIAILAILVIFAIPNVLKRFNESKKKLFINEIKTVYKEAKSIYISSKLIGAPKTILSSKNNDIDLSGEELSYCVLLDNNGEVKYMFISNDSFYSEFDIRNDDITKIDDNYIFNKNDEIIIDCNTLADNYDNINDSFIVDSNITIEDDENDDVEPVDIIEKPDFYFEVDGIKHYCLNDDIACKYVEENNVDWKLYFYQSGNLYILNEVMIDAFLVGGGGGGSSHLHYSSTGGTYAFVNGGAGGGGGYTLTERNLTIGYNTYNIIVGSGGTGGAGKVTNKKVGADGESSTAFGLTALGGSGGSFANTRTQGGNGGSGGGSGGYVSNSSGKGGSNGNDGNNVGNQNGGNGQGTTTCEFEEGTENGCNDGIALYSGGGGGGKNWSSNHGSSSGSTGGEGGGGNGNETTSAAKSGKPNTGGGGGGGHELSTNGSNHVDAGNGGSGIVVIRNARNLSENIPKSSSETVYGFYYRAGDKNHFCENGDTACSYIDEGNGNWKLELYVSGILHYFNEKNIDVFLVGGGGGGGNTISYSSLYGTYAFLDGGAGGGGGYTLTKTNIKISPKDYEIVIGKGGKGGNGKNPYGFNGNPSIAFGYTAEGGFAGTNKSGGKGGSGGGSPGHTTTSSGNGGSYGNDGGSSYSYKGGLGQGTTTCEFSEGTLNECNSGIKSYGAGGGGGKNWSSNHGGSSGGLGGLNGGGNGNESTSTAKSGTPNTGGGGGGGHQLSTNGKNFSNGGKGGSGIVIIRNHR